jgi:hypothetical protein
MINERLISMIWSSRSSDLSVVGYHLWEELKGERNKQYYHTFQELTEVIINVT